MTDEAETTGAPDPRGVELLELQHWTQFLREWNARQPLASLDRFDPVRECLEMARRAHQHGYAAAEARAEPVWSREVPTVDGWYRWYSTVGTIHVFPVKVYGQRMGMYRDGVGGNLPSGGWWRGPIDMTPPAEPGKM